MNLDLPGVVPVAVNVSIAIVSLAMVLTFARLIIGPSLLDRIVALELFATLVVGAIAVYDIATEQPVFLDVATVVALIGFLGAVVFARHIERRAAP